MIDQDLVTALSGADSLPADEIRLAQAEPERIADAVLDVLRRGSEGADLTDPEVNLLFWGVHVLAAARDTRVFRPLLAMLRLDGETLDGLLGDMVSETLAPILNSVFDGDAEPLFGLILDSTIDDPVRRELFAVLVFLTRAGSVPRQETHDLLMRFDDKRVAVEGDESWLAWMESIALLGFRSLLDRVNIASTDGRIEPMTGDVPWLLRTIRVAETTPDDPARFDPLRHATLDDPLEALSWTREIIQEPVRNPYKHVGRNDPCPCGSGRKFKKCCLGGAVAPEDGPRGAGA